MQLLLNCVVIHLCIGINSLHASVIQAAIFALFTILIRMASLSSMCVGGMKLGEKWVTLKWATNQTCM